jgi:hypothetical protein
MAMNANNRRGAHRFAPSILLCCLAAITGCSLNPVADSEAGNPSIVLADALISLPTALAADTAQPAKSRQAAAVDPAGNLYSFIRLQNFFVNTLINGDSMSIRSFLEKDCAQLPWRYIVEQGRYSVDSLSLRTEAAYERNKTLPYSVTLSFDHPVLGWTVRAAFNGDRASPRGYVYFFTDYTGDIRTDSLVMLVTFEKSLKGRQVDIAIKQNLLVPDQSLASAFRYSWHESQGIMHVSGMTYHPYLDSILRDTVGYCLTYTAVADTARNIAIVNLGLPPATYSDTAELFTTFGIAEMYQNYFVDYCIPALSDTGKMVLATSIKDTLTLLQILSAMQDTVFRLRDPSEADDLTGKDLVFYLEMHKDIIPLILRDEAAQKQYMALLWILKLRQPVYFNALGYAGNGRIPPAGFATLSLLRCNRPRFIPAEIKNLRIMLP